MSTDIDGLKEWISKVERDGNERHAENAERMAVLERDHADQTKRDSEMKAKMDAILDILTQVKGVVTLLKVSAWIITVGGGIALIYGAFFKARGK